MSKTIRYTEHMSPTSVSAKRRLMAAMRRARRQHPKATAREAFFHNPDQWQTSPIVVRVEVPA